MFACTYHAVEPNAVWKNELAEGVRFELTRPFGLPVFKTGAFNRSATPPENYGRENCATGAALSKAALVNLSFRP
jgi:hypothetical protein